MFIKQLLEQMRDAKIQYNSLTDTKHYHLELAIPSSLSSQHCAKRASMVTYHHHGHGLVDMIGPQHGGDIGSLEDRSPYSSGLVNLLLNFCSL